MKDILTQKVNYQDFIRIKRVDHFDRELLSKYGIAIFLIEKYLYDHEVIKYEDRDKYELIRVSDFISEGLNISSIKRKHND